MLKRLLGDNVLIQVDEEEKTLKSGIVIPDNVATPIRQGTVLMVGPGKYYPDRYVATEVKVGERVAFFIGAADTKGGKMLQHHVENNQVLLREVDILFTFTDNVRVEI